MEDEEGLFLLVLKMLPTVLRRLREANMIFVSHAKRDAGGHFFQLGACTVNRLAVFAEAHARGMIEVIFMSSSSSLQKMRTRLIYERKNEMV